MGRLLTVKMFSYPTANSTIEQLQLASKSGFMVNDETQVISIDTKSLKSVSDQLTRKLGDQYNTLNLEIILQELNMTHNILVVSRFSGDEFVVLANPKQQESEALQYKLTSAQEHFYSQQPDINSPLYELLSQLNHVEDKNGNTLYPGSKIQVAKLGELQDEDIQSEEIRRGREVLGYIFSNTEKQNLKDSVDPDSILVTVVNNLNTERKHIFSNSPIYLLPDKVRSALFQLINSEYGISLDLLENNQLDPINLSLLEGALFESMYDRGQIWRVEILEKLALKLAETYPVRIRRMSDLLLKSSNEKSHTQGDKNMKTTVSVKYDFPNKGHDKLPHRQALIASFPDAFLFQHHGSFFIMDIEPRDEKLKTKQKIDFNSPDKIDSPFVVVTNNIIDRLGRSRQIIITPTNLKQIKENNYFWIILDTLRDQHYFNEQKLVRSAKSKHQKEIKRTYNSTRIREASVKLEEMKLRLDYLPRKIWTLLTPPPPQPS